MAVAHNAVAARQETVELPLNHALYGTDSYQYRGYQHERA